MDSSSTVEGAPLQAIDETIRANTYSTVSCQHACLLTFGWVKTARGTWFFSVRVEKFSTIFVFLCLLQIGRAGLSLASHAACLLYLEHRLSAGLGRGEVRRAVADTDRSESAPVAGEEEALHAAQRAILDMPHKNALRESARERDFRSWPIATYGSERAVSRFRRIVLQKSASGRSTSKNGQ